MKTLDKVGVPAVVTGIHGQNYRESDVESHWSIVCDTSIMAPEPGLYNWAKIEIDPPAYLFTAEALEEVARVCQVIRTTYRVSTNRSCGLNVHIGMGQISEENSSP